MALGGEPVDPSEDDLLDGPGDIDLDVVVEPPLLTLPNERAGVDEGADQLLQVERIAFGMGQDSSLQRWRQRAGPDERREQRPVGLARERLQTDLARAVRKLARRHLL